MPPFKQTPNKTKKCKDCQGLFDSKTSMSDHRCDSCFKEDFPSLFNRHGAPKTIGKKTEVTETTEIKPNSRGVVTTRHNPDGSTQTFYSYPKYEPPKGEKTAAQQVFDSLRKTFGSVRVSYPPPPPTLTGTKRAAKNMVKRMKRNNFPLTEEQYVTLKNLVARMKGRYE